MGSSLLSKITKGKIKKPIYALVYGVPGCGKSSWAADAPDVIFIGKEDGTNNLNISRFPEAKTYEDIQAAIKTLNTENHEFKSVAFDSLDWIEPLLQAYVCRKHGWKDIEAPGYGKGYIAALDEWRVFLDSVGLLREKGMNVIFIAHSHVKPHNDPSQVASYDRHKMKLNDKASALLMEAVDFVGFATFEVFTKTESGSKKSKAFGDGKRVLYTGFRPSFDAKNRYDLPHELPLSWSAFMDAYLKGEPDSLETILSDLNEIALPAEKIESLKNAIEKANGNIEQLVKIRNYARTLAGE